MIIQWFRLYRHNYSEVLRRQDPVAMDAPSITSRQRSEQRRYDRDRRCGCRARLTAMLKANPQRMPLPAILLSKVRSPEDKLDNLMLDFTSKQEVTGCCAISLIETRLKPSVPDDAVSIEGLTTFWLDRSCSLNGKSRDGSVCIYINNNWWNNVKLVCSPDI